MRLTTTICHSNDATQLYNKKIQKRQQTYKVQEKIIHFVYDIKIFAKNENELETLIQTIGIFSQDIRMEFGIEKCAMLIMKKRKKKEITEELELPDLESIRTFGG